MRETLEQSVKKDAHNAPEGITSGPENQELRDPAEEIEAYCTTQMELIDIDVNGARAENESLLEDAIKRFDIKPEDREYQKLKSELKQSTGIFEKLRRKAKILLPFIFGALLLGKGTRMAQEGADESFIEASHAADQLTREGITDERKRAYIPHISELIYKTVIPRGYDTDEKIDSIVQNVITRIEEDAGAMKENETLYRSETNKDREDAWRLYLGLPQRNNTFGVSQYKPERGVEDKYYYSINNWLEKFSEGVRSWLHYVKVPTNEKDFNPVKALVEAIQRSDKLQKESWQGEFPVDGGFLILPGHEAGSAYITFDYRSGEAEQMPDIGIMGTFKISKGQDERGHYLSYYDRWDVSGSLVEGKNGLIGLPFEIYDRIYYNLDTFELIPEEKFGVNTDGSSHPIERTY